MAPLGEAGQKTHVILRRSETTTTVVIVGLAIVASVSVGLLIVILVSRLRKRKFEETTSEKTSRKWHGSFLSWKENPAEHEPSYDDIQREVLIRKSLASRAESRASGQLSPTSEDDAEVEEEQDLRTDWKQWEARVHHERSISSESHPALGSPADEPRELELLRPISTISSLNWNPLDEMPQMPTTARTAGSYSQSPRLHTGVTYDRITTNDDNDARV